MRLADIPPRRPTAKPLVRVLGFAVGALLGATATLAAWPGDETRVRRTAAAPASSTRPTNDTSLVPSAQAPSEAKDECLAERAEVMALRARLQSRESASNDAHGARRADPRCTVVPWPPDLPEEFSEETLRKRLAEHLAGVDVELDCSEFPCLAVIEGAETSELATFKTSAFAGAQVYEHVFVSGGQSHVLFAALPPGSDDEAIRQRLQGRIDAHSRELMRAAEDRRAEERPKAPDAAQAPPEIKLLLPLPGQK
jgi:hypothetical protein